MLNFKVHNIFIHATLNKRINLVLEKQDFHRKESITINKF